MLLKAVQEVMFLFQFMQSMNISVKLPITVRVNEVVTIFMAYYVTITCCTKHMDTQYKYVNKYVEDG